MLNLSYYEEYPIYEPAEGGYFYAGCSCLETERLSRRQAKKKFSDLIKEFEADGWTWDGHWMLYRKGNYIGDNCFYCLEYKEGSHASGRQIYC